MQSNTSKFKILLPLVLIALFLSAAQSDALVVADSSSTLYWNTFTISMSQGMSLTFREDELYSYATSRIDVGSNIAAVYDDQSVYGWSTDVSSSASYPGISHTSSVNNADGTLNSQSAINNAGYEMLHTQDTAQRTGYFDVIGNGTITFTIDYLLDSFASNSGPDQGYAGARAGLSLNNLSLGPELEGWNGVQAYSYAQSYLGESMSKSDWGTISVSVDFTDGQWGSIIAQAFTSATYEPLERPVPEPSMMTLMVCALAGLMLLKKNRA